MFSKTGLAVVLFAAFLLLGCAQSGPDLANGSVRTAPVLISTQNSSGGQGMAGAVQNGDTIKVDYLGTSNGTVFDTSIEAEAKKAGLPPRPTYAPLQFTVGAGQMIPGFDKAVVGMRVGEEKTAVLAPKDAYGEKDPKAIVEVQKSMFDNSSTPAVGLQVMSPQGYPGVITNVSKDNVTIDFNHELAGKTLTFKIILREIVKK